jgi:hypothetical protein
MLKSAIGAAGVVASPFASTALAAPCTGINVGTSQTSDVTFAGLASDACVISGVNPAQGANGNTSRFSASPFGTGWSLLGKVETSSGGARFGSVNFTWRFNSGAGTWSLKADQNVTLDLVFGMHASDHSGAFLFDDQPLVADVVTPGAWSIH